MAARILSASQLDLAYQFAHRLKKSGTVHVHIQLGLNCDRFASLIDSATLYTVCKRATSVQSLTIRLSKRLSSFRSSANYEYGKYRICPQIFTGEIPPSHILIPCEYCQSVSSCQAISSHRRNGSFSALLRLTLLPARYDDMSC